MINTINIWSANLHSTILLKVIRSEQAEVQKVMLLLHGLMNPEASAEILERMPEELGLEELCNQYGMMVVIPLMPNRYYISTEAYNCDLFIAKELPQAIVKEYGISEGTEWILAGISMGGFGTVCGKECIGSFGIVAKR